MSRPFSVGRRWLCSSPGRARFWFVILGPGYNCMDKPSVKYKTCRIEVHPDDLRDQMPGYKSHGMVASFSHRHIEKYASLVEEDPSG